MRILFALPYVPSLIRVRPYQLIRELCRRHEITVLASGTGRDGEDVARLRALCRGVHVACLRPAASLRSCTAAALRGEPLQAAVCRSPEMVRLLSDLLARERFDVVHVEHLRAAFLGAQLPGDVPTLFDAVDCISLLLARTLRASHSLRQRLLAALELRRTQAYEARLLARFDQVTVTSAEDGQALRARVPAARVAVVPNGVDFEYFQPVTGPREPATLVLSGKMSYHANVTAALHFVRQIFPLIRERRPDVRLRIVGSAPPHCVQALARDPAVSVTGYQPDIRCALGRATVAVCPVTVKVGIQNKVLEAMAMSLPVVCTAQGAQGLAAQPGRDLLVASTPAAFASHVCRLLANPDLRDAVGQAGRRYVQTHHRWAAAAGTLETLYTTALERRAGRGSRADRIPLHRRSVSSSRGGA